MPRIRLDAISLLAAMLLTAAPAPAQGIRWQHDIETAKAEAQKSGRLVLVHVWSDSCGPCQALENNVFKQPGVAGVIESQFVPVKLNANEYPATAQGFGITRVPTDVILTPDGHMIGKFISPATPAAYVAETGQVVNQYRSQSGHVYQMAAANAPQPAMLNPAYANLHVTHPTMPQAAAAPAVPSIPATPVSQPVATPTPSMFGPPSAITPPAVVPNPLAGDRYGMPLTAPPPAPAATPSLPNQTTNPYVPQPQTAAPAAPAFAPPQYRQPPVQPAAPVTGYDAAAPAAVSAPSPGTIQPSETVAPAQPTTTATATPTPPTQADLPAGAPPIGFDGYCPVSMRTHWKWLPGNVQFGAIHRGHTYVFASQQEQQQFLANPDYYAPALSGIDPVLAIDHRQTVPGIREHSLDFDNQFFLFSSEATLEQFTANPQRYAAGVRQAMGLPPAQRR